MNDPIAKAYLKVIEEATSSGIVDSTKSQVGKTFGNKESDKKAHETAPKSSTENVENELEDVEEAPSELTSDGATGELEKVKESSNPFDALYNKVINEEMFDFSTEDNSLEPSEGTETDDSLEEFDDESEDEEEADEVTFTLDRETAQKLHDVLKSVLGDEEEEEEAEEESKEGLEDFDLEGENEEESDEVKQEAVEAEYHGHALVDQEKLERGMTKPSNKEVKGAVPVSKKRAEVVKGKKADGKPEKCTDNPEELTSKSKFDVGGVKTGKFLFDQ